MSDALFEIIVAAFQNETGADDAFRRLGFANKERAVGVQNIAVIRRHPNNSLLIRETDGWGESKGSAAGALIGGTIGLLFSPGILVSSVLGATFATLAMQLEQSGFNGTRLKELGASLRPGTSALIAVVETASASALERDIVAQGAVVVREPVEAQVMSKFEQAAFAVLHEKPPHS